MSKKEYVQQVFGARIKSFSDSAKWFRRRHYVTATGALALTLAITVVSGLKLSALPEPVVTNIVLVLGALSSFVTAWGSFFAPRESWALYAQTGSELRAINDLLNKDLDAMTDQQVDGLFDMYQAALAKHNEAWSKLRKQDI
jgi:hypothetical protein